MSRVTVALALLAALVPASVALVGYWFKQQSDKRLALQHEQDDYRSKIDLALRATDLFGHQATPRPAQQSPRRAC
jgi:hypothetical protein